MCICDELLQILLGCWLVELDIAPWQVVDGYGACVGEDCVLGLDVDHHVPWQAEVDHNSMHGVPVIDGASSAEKVRRCGGNTSTSAKRKRESA